MPLLNCTSYASDERTYRLTEQEIRTLVYGNTLQLVPRSQEQVFDNKCHFSNAPIAHRSSSPISSDQIKRLSFRSESRQEVVRPVRRLSALHQERKAARLPSPRPQLDDLVVRERHQRNPGKNLLGDEVLGLVPRP